MFSSSEIVINTISLSEYHDLIIPGQLSPGWIIIDLRSNKSQASRLLHSQARTFPYDLLRTKNFFEILNNGAATSGDPYLFDFLRSQRPMRKNIILCFDPTQPESIKNKTALINFLQQKLSTINTTHHIYVLADENQTPMASVPPIMTNMVVKEIDFYQFRSLIVPTIPPHIVIIDCRRASESWITPLWATHAASYSVVFGNDISEKNMLTFLQCQKPQIANHRTIILLVDNPSKTNKEKFLAALAFHSKNIRNLYELNLATEIPPDLLKPRNLPFSPIPYEKNKPTEVQKNLLYLGDAANAQLWPSEQENIFIINAAAKEVEKFFSTRSDIHYISFYVPDLRTSSLKRYFLPIIQTILYAKNNNRKVLIHCYAGVSRSPTLVLAYLMFERYFQGKNYDPDPLLPGGVYQELAEKRPIICPNSGFMQDLYCFKQALDEVAKLPFAEFKLPYLIARGFGKERDTLTRLKSLFLSLKPLALTWPSQ